MSISPDTPALKLLRADTMTAKAGTRAFMNTFLAQHVSKMLANDDGTMELTCDEGARAICAALEDNGKEALQRLVVTQGREKTMDDPIYAYLRGKNDSKYLTALTIVWEMSESLQSWINPHYTVKTTTNPIYARMALHRTLLGEIDRRAVMVQNKRHIAANPYLTNLVSGASAEEMGEFMAQKKHKSGSSAALSGPKCNEQRNALAMQMLFKLASQSQTRCIDPADALHMFRNDTHLQKHIKWPADLVRIFSDMSQRFGAIAQIGKASEGFGVEWTDLDAKAPVTSYIPVGRRGGRGTAPAVQVHESGHDTVKACLTHCRSLYCSTDPEVAAAS